MEIVKECPWCHKRFKAKTNRRVYCSDTCRQASYRWTRKSEIVLINAELEPVKAVRHPVTKEEIAEAIVSVRSALGVFSAGRLTTTPNLRPVCERFENALGELLEREGL